MSLLRFAAIAAFASLATPGLAADGLLDSCPSGQSFTAGGIAVTGAYTRAMLPRAASAGGYLGIANAGAAPDRLTGVTSAAAKRVEVHQMRLENDVMIMAPVEDGLEIPAGASVALEPSGYHLMFMGIGTPFAEGQCVVVTLEFAEAGPLEVALNVGAVAQNEPVMDHGGGHGTGHDMGHGGAAMPGM